MIQSSYLGGQLWQNDWHMYQKPGIRVEVWGEIQLNVFTSARVGEYIVSAGSYAYFFVAVATPQPLY